MRVSSKAAWLFLGKVVLTTTISMGYAASATTAPPSGGTLFQTYCSVCHGERGDGQSRARGSFRTPPRDFTSEESRKQLSRESMIATVRDGRPGSAMVAWKSQLSEAEMTMIVDYIRERFMNSAANKTANVEAARGQQLIGSHKPAPAMADGNEKNGQRLYAQNCVPCHGANGGGDGPRAYFIQPRPRNFRAAESRAVMTRAALVQGIANGVPGREMPAWDKVLTKQEIADVAQYVYATFVQTSP